LAFIAIIPKHTRNARNAPILECRGGLGPKSLHGNRFYKGHRYIAGKASVPVKMYLKSLAIIEKVSISPKKLSKIIEIFIKAPHF
jgi:hypothetical protein